jgi:hypothetical protein
MNEFLQLAQVIGEQVKNLLEPLRIQIAELQKESESLKQVKQISVSEVAEAAAKLMPAPKDGEKGADGKDGISPDIEAVIAAVSAQFERRFSDHLLSMERQAREAQERAIDKLPIPKDGKDGKDAMPVEEIDIQLNERKLTIKLGDTVKELTLPALIDRGVWKEGNYEKGDCVSYDGSLWIAREDTEDAPSTSKAWRLSVKKGRDGRDLRDNASKHDKSKGLKL